MSYFRVSILWALSLKTDADKCLWVSKSYGATSLWAVDRKLNIDRMKLLNKKNWHVRQYQVDRLIAGKWSSTQWRSACMPANINKVEDLALSEENKLRKQFTVENCMTD